MEVEDKDEDEEEEDDQGGYGVEHKDNRDTVKDKEKRSSAANQKNKVEDEEEVEDGNKMSTELKDFIADVSDMEDSDLDEDDDEDEGAGAGQEHEEDVGDEQLDFVHRQPLVGKGMAATLALLKGTGELKKTDQLAGRAKVSRAYDPSSADMGVKLEYRDEFGRKLTQKEHGPSQKKK